MFHLSNPSRGIRDIKIIDLISRKMEVMMKAFGMKGHNMGGVNTT
jgi:hypothetical protein